MHLDLYLTGYRAIATIGPLFLVQAITAIGIGLALVFVDRVPLILAGAGFSLSTMAGYLLSRAFGIFGFHEIATQAGTFAEIVELLAFVVLAEVLVTHARLRSRLVRSGPSNATRSAQILVAVIGIAIMTLTIHGAAWSSGAARTNVIGATRVNERSITITNFAYVPASITVGPGAAILVINDDSVAHSITANAGSGTSPAFNSGNIGPGHRAVIHAPLKPGSYPYFCDIHNFMTGVITVKP